MNAIPHSTAPVLQPLDPDLERGSQGKHLGPAGHRFSVQPLAAGLGCDPSQFRKASAAAPRRNIVGKQGFSQARREGRSYFFYLNHRFNIARACMYFQFRHNMY
ncbi:hypothetical protein PPUJ13061_32270 [Pseudomonas putida]|nr:hypothetical protein PPUJ13061_32270 [Pseudomonas putida]